MDRATIILTIVSSVLASTGLWGLVTGIIDKRCKQTTAETQMLIGLAHDRICYLGEKYIKRGWITKNEYENLHDYLYCPYYDLGGNGTAERIMAEVTKLPLHD